MNSEEKIKINLSYQNKDISIYCSSKEKLSDILLNQNMDINSVNCIYSGKKLESKDIIINQIINDSDKLNKEINILIINIEEKESFNKFGENEIILTQFNDDIEKIILKLKEVKGNVNNLFKSEENNIINNNIISKDDLNEIDKNAILSDINGIIKDNNINNKFKQIMKIYNKIVPKCIITMIYNAGKSKEEIKILNEKFVNNNKDKCKIIFEDDEYELKEMFKNKKKEILEIKLKVNSDITNLENMFKGCESLISLPDISKLNTKNVKNMNSMFYGCISLTFLSDISKWNISNVNNLSNLFYRCSKFLTLPDISGWNTTNVKDMSGLFYRCSSLKSLPDISKWDTKNVSDINRIFYGCSSLKSIPDISKWNSNNFVNMAFMFGGCYSLTSIPDISKWKFKKDENINIDLNSMFYECLNIL